MAPQKTGWISHFPARRPNSFWNGWFAIALFQEGPFAWLKTHAYVPAAKQAGYPIASLEGFANSPEVAWMAALHGFQPPVHTVHEAALEVTPDGLRQEQASWRWEGDALVAEGALLGRRATLRATGIAPQSMRWAAIRGFLHYRSLTANMELQWGDEIWHGAGLIEHAWGAYLPVPAGQLVPGDWQWDVLLEQGEKRRFHVALTARWLGLTFEPRAFIDDSGAVRAVRSQAIEVELEESGVPTVWHGTIGGKEYRAERSGKALHPFKGGAFFGFNYTMNGTRGIGFAERITHHAQRSTKVPAPYPAFNNA